MKKLKLTIELVPKTSWYDNVRSNVSSDEWDRIRKAQYKKSGYKCEICGAKDIQLHCHEIWYYDDVKHRQILIGLVSLCPDCHNVKHIGRAMMMGELQQCIKHLMKVNKMNEQKAIEYIDKCFAVWHERSQHKWEVDISFIELALEENK